MAPTSILFLVRELGIGGCERDLAKLALTIDKNKFTPHVGYFREGFRVPELRQAGIPLVEFPVRSFSNRTMIDGARQFGSYIQQHDIRLVHAWDIPLSIFTAPVARFYRVPVLITSMLGHRYILSRRDHSLLRLSDWLSPNVLVNSQAVGRHMIDSEKIDPRKLFINHNGYLPEVFFPPTVLAGQAGKPRPPALEGADLVIGTICALREEKNIPLLIDAFARMRRGPGVKLAIVGSGPVEPVLRAQIKRLDLEAACHFEPACPDVAQWFRAMDIFVLPSISESFPNSLLEAMACGCAVVATRVGGIPELVAHEGNGLLVDNRDQAGLAAALERLCEDQQFRERLGDSAASHALQHFTMKQYCHKIESYYEGLLRKALPALY